MGRNVGFWGVSWMGYEGAGGGGNLGNSWEGRRDFEGPGSWAHWWVDLVPDRCSSWLMGLVIEAWTSINFFVKSSTAKGERWPAVDEGKVRVLALPTVLEGNWGGDVCSCWGTPETFRILACIRIALSCLLCAFSSLTLLLMVF